ncbi:MAG: hypothetical protein ACOX28_00190 [Bacilli bacterium]|jgi:hypothetical protein
MEYNEDLETSQQVELEPTQTRKVLNDKKLRSIKVWQIIGCILTPIIVIGNLTSTLEYYAFYFLFIYALTIPLTMLAIRASRKSEKPKDLILFGVLSLIFVSIIGGIIMLAVKEKDYITVEEI